MELFLFAVTSQLLPMVMTVTREGSIAHGKPESDRQAIVRDLSAMDMLPGGGLKQIRVSPIHDSTRLGNREISSEWIDGPPFARWYTAKIQGDHCTL